MGRKFSDQTIARLAQVRELLYSMAPPEVIIHRLAREWKVRPQIVTDYIRMVRAEWANEVEIFGGSATADEREFRREHVRKALHRQALRALSRTKRRTVREFNEAAGREIERVEREPNPDEATFSRAIDALIRLDGLEAPKQVKHTGALGVAVAVAEGDVPKDTPGLMDFLTRAATGALEPGKTQDGPIVDGEQEKAEKAVVRPEGADQRNQSVVRAATKAAAKATATITSPGEPTAATPTK